MPHIRLSGHGSPRSTMAHGKEYAPDSVYQSLYCPVKTPLLDYFEHCSGGSPRGKRWGATRLWTTGPRHCGNGGERGRMARATDTGSGNVCTT